MLSNLIFFILLFLCEMNTSMAVGHTFSRTDNYFINLNKSTRNQIVFTIFRLIWNQTDVRLFPNQSENVIYNLISG